MKKAVILVSGGLDSATTLAIAKSKNFDCFAITINYGQKHIAEIDAAKTIGEMLDVRDHKFVSINLYDLGGSSLMQGGDAVEDFKDSNSIPSTYVPARNTTFLSVALGYAEAIGAYDIFIGACQLDYSGYPDCREEFINEFENIANIATKAGTEGERFKIHAPLLNLSKAETIKTGTSLGVDYRKTISCYRADKNGLACGSCDSCSYRKKGFIDAKIKDPTNYVLEKII